MPASVFTKTTSFAALISRAHGWLILLDETRCPGTSSRTVSGRQESATPSGPSQSSEMVRFAESNRVRRPVSYDMVAMMLAMEC